MGVRKKLAKWPVKKVSLAESETRLALGRARDDGQAHFPVAPLKSAMPRGYGETHLVEWKEPWRDEYLKWLCGFANADGKLIGQEAADITLCNLAAVAASGASRLRSSTSNLRG